MPATFKDYYATLGIPSDASPADIKQAFRKLARIHHPDTATDKSSAEATFKEINEAHEVLSDPEKRARYDQLKSLPPEPDPQNTTASDRDFHFTGTGFSDFFEQYFASGTPYGFPHAHSRHAQSSPTPTRGSDIEGDLLVTLEEAMHGTLRPLSLQSIDRQTGKVSSRQFEVRIPPGAIDGRRLRIPGEGEPGSGGAPPGDLYLRVRHAAHPDFSSHGPDLLLDLEIPPWDAVLGAESLVRTLDGPIRLRIPQGTQNAHQLRARGRGLPKAKSGERGDLLITLHITLPESLTPESRTLWEQLRTASTHAPATP
jgi:curved DNA-binding protein